MSSSVCRNTVNRTGGSGNGGSPGAFNAATNVGGATIAPNRVPTA
jgi:hypothetical protein